MPFDFTPHRLFAMDPLRWKALWLALGAVLVATVVIASLIDLGPVGGVMLHDKLVHLCVYAVLMGWFAQLFRHDLTRLLLALGFVALGIGIEFLQGLVPRRQFEQLDMLANTSGVLLAWALAYTRFGELLPALERALARLSRAVSSA